MEALEADESLRLLLQLTEDPVVIFKVGLHLEDARVTYANGAFFKLTRYSSDHILNTPAGKIFEALSPVSESNLLTVYKEVLNGKRVRMEMRIETAEQTFLWLDLSIIPLMQKTRQSLTHVAFTGRDITLGRQLQDQAIQLQRAVAMGSLATSLGHELNNPLGYTRSNVDFCLGQMAGLLERVKALGQGEIHEDMLEVYHALVEAQDGLERSCQIAGELRSFSYTQQGEWTESLNLGEILKEVLANHLDMITQKATLRRTLPALPLIQGQNSKLKFALGQLVKAFGKLLPPGQPQNVATLRAHLDLEAQEIAIVLEDELTTLRKDQIEQLFEPFYALTPHQDADLSLTLCRSIVESQFGSIQVLGKTPGPGIEFHVRLRLAPPRSAPATLEHPVPGPLEVLVIDDNRPLLRSIGRLLKDVHHTALQPSPLAALKCFEDPDYEVDLILCDMLMPRMSGKKFVETLIAWRPHYAERFLIMTACVPDDGQQSMLNFHKIPVLLKPFSREELIEAIDRRHTQASDGRG